MVSVGEAPAESPDTSRARVPTPIATPRRGNAGSVTRGTGAVSAATNSAALANRSAGTFSSAVAPPASTASGTAGRSTRRRPRRLGHQLGDNRLGVAPVNGGSPREHLVEHRAEGVDVAPRVELALARRLLRDSCTAACRARGRSPSAASPPAFLHRQRDAEVGDHRLRRRAAGCSRA